MQQSIWRTINQCLMGFNEVLTLCNNKKSRYRNMRNNGGLTQRDSFEISIWNI